MLNLLAVCATNWNLLFRKIGALCSGFLVKREHPLCQAFSYWFMTVKRSCTPRITCINYIILKILSNKKIITVPANLPSINEGIISAGREK